MNAQQLHHQSVPHEFLYSADQEDFTQLNLSEQLMHEDFEWEDYESEYADESLPNHILAFVKESDWE